MKKVLNAALLSRVNAIVSRHAAKAWVARPNAEKRSWYNFVAKESEADIYIYDEISSWWGVSANDFVSDLNEISASTINLYINSPGGIVTAGMAIYDTMQFIRPAVSTLCIGQAASMGSLLLAAGHKDMRFATPNARIMVHQPSGGFQGQASDIERHARDILKMKRRLNEVYVKHTGRTLEEVEKTLDRDHFMDADEAQSWGVIDRVMTSRVEVEGETA